MSKTNNTLTLSDKLQLIKDHEGGLKTRDLAKKYKINQATASRIIRKKDAIRESATTLNVHRKRQRQSAHGDLEDALNIWIREMNDLNIEITKQMATQKALEMAKEMSVNVYPGSPWIWRWLKRVNFKPNDAEHKSNLTPAEYQFEQIFEEKESVGSPARTTKMETCSSEEDFKGSNGIQIESVKILSTSVKPKQQQQKKQHATKKTANCSNQPKNYEKHRWLGDLVVTQMEESHPDDRADFAWEIHKLIRQFQLKRRNLEDD